jgi:cobalt-zinc-cadmium efflux system protein
MVAELHTPRVSLEHRLLAAIAIATAAAVLELAGSWLSNSLALLSDAGHVGTDAVGLGLAFVALRMSRRPHTMRMSFGYHRMEVVAALANALLLAGFAVFLMFQAYDRTFHPPQIQGGLMLAIGLLGLAANMATLVLLREWARQNINARGAFLHAYGDALGSVGVVAAALVIQITGLIGSDIVVSVLIAALILVSAARLLRDGVQIILQASPSELDPRKVAEAMERMPGVAGVHDLHIWTVTSGHFVLTGHIRIDGNTTVKTAADIVERTIAMLRERFGIAHATLQVDSIEAGMIPMSEVTPRFES